MGGWDLLSRRVAVCISLLSALILLAGCGRGEKDRDEDEESNSPQNERAEGGNTETGGEDGQYGVEIVGGMVYSFDADKQGVLPGGWSQERTGEGSMGSWVVMQDPSAPSQPNVFAQVSQDETDYRFPVAVIDSSSFKDLQLSAKFRALKGKVDQGAGLVFRFRDSNNYYVVRANGLEDNVNFYKVVDGRRKQLTGSNTKVSSGQWHTLIVEAKGETVECYLDGKKLFESQDDTFAGPGKVGLWTKADSYILFDDFTVKALVGGE